MIKKAFLFAIVTLSASASFAARLNGGGGGGGSSSSSTDIYPATNTVQAPYGIDASTGDFSGLGPSGKGTVHVEGEYFYTGNALSIRNTGPWLALLSSSGISDGGAASSILYQGRITDGGATTSSWLMEYAKYGRWGVYNPANGTGMEYDFTNVDGYVNYSAGDNWRFCFDGTVEGYPGLSECMTYRTTALPTSGKDDHQFQFWGDQFVYYGDVEFNGNVVSSSGTFGSNLGLYNFSGSTLTINAPPTDLVYRLLSIYNGTGDWVAATLDGAEESSANIFTSTGGNSFIYGVTVGSLTVNNLPAGYAYIDSNHRMTTAAVSGSGTSIYPATATASLPYGLSASTLTLTAMPGAGPLYVNSAGIVSTTTAAGSKPPKEYYWPAIATLALQVADSIATVGKSTGTNIDQLVVDFDQFTDECRTVNFRVPSDVNTGGNATFRANWFSTGTVTNSVIWDIRHNGGVTEGVTPDTALTTVAASADAAQGTAGQLTVTTWTLSLATAGWAANDQVDLEICRDANNAGDTLATDARMTGFAVDIPRT